MGKLIYMMNVSLDGFIETTDHDINWATVDEELHGWFNDYTRGIDASLYGRRMYELMNAYWPTAASDPEATPMMVEYAGLWVNLPRVVFSTTLDSVDGNARLARGDIGDELARLRTEYSGDLDVAGASLAAEFVRGGLVDEYRLIVHPVALGVGTPFFPELERPLHLRLAETHTFTSGVMYLRYETVP